MTKKKESGFLELIEKYKSSTNYIFLGVGLCLFAINISTFMSFIKTPDYSMVWFSLAILSSVLIILLSVYNMNSK